MADRCDPPTDARRVADPSRRRLHAAALVAAGAGLAACQSGPPRPSRDEAGLPSNRAMAAGGD